jgi:hypothetical protein
MLQNYKYDKMVQRVFTKLQIWKKECSQGYRYDKKVQKMDTVLKLA